MDNDYQVGDIIVWHDYDVGIIHEVTPGYSLLYWYSKHDGVHMFTSREKLIPNDDRIKLHVKDNRVKRPEPWSLCAKT